QATHGDLQESFGGSGPAASLQTVPPSQAFAGRRAGGLSGVQFLRARLRRRHSAPGVRAPPSRVPGAEGHYGATLGSAGPAAGPGLAQPRPATAFSRGGT